MTPIFNLDLSRFGFESNTPKMKRNFQLPESEQSNRKGSF